MRTPYFQKPYVAGIGVIALLCALHGIAYYADTRALLTYRSLESTVTYDRTGAVVDISPNARKQICLFAASYPESVRKLVLAKEDRWFYYHPGINPSRTLRATLAHLAGTSAGGASTITQQLAKTLLGTGNERTLTNKLKELLLSFALEYRHTKAELLTMYLNTAGLGGNVQGFATAARVYFDKSVETLNESEILQLVAALSNPGKARPLSEANRARADMLATALGATPTMSYTKNDEKKDVSWFELSDTLRECAGCTATIDVAVNERIRDIMRTHIARSREEGLTHGAVVVVDVHTGEVLAMVGSPDPLSVADGMRINMALAERPIGSTIKPFLYLQGFEKGLRPYTYVEDREYKFDVATGFPLYPKNYDGKYRGTVTLEEALANSLNVPTVAVLRYITLPDCTTYLDRTLGFKPPQPWESYAYGIALGGLELDLTTLTQAFTALADHGTLKRLITAHTPMGESYYFTPPHSTLTETRTIADPRYVELVNAILTDRTAGVEEFGQQGSLNLSRSGYGVKTGTSRDFHDSWTVGFTGDYAVGVWMGNAKNKPMKQISGVMGAGSLWHDVMELMFTTHYYQGTPLNMSQVVPVPNERGYSYGLADDDAKSARTLLAEKDLILFPHDHDVFLYTPTMRIPLTSSREATWEINGTPFMQSEGGWHPTAPGTYHLTAIAGKLRENVEVTLTEEPAKMP